MDTAIPVFDREAFLSQLGTYQHFEQLISFLPDANYFAKDIWGRFVLADDGFVALLGCQQREQLLGKTDFDFFPGDVARKFVADDRKVIKTGIPLRNHPEPMPNTDLTFSWWVVNKVPLCQPSGKIVGVAGITSRLTSNHSGLSYGSNLFAVLDYIGRSYGEKVAVQDLAGIAGLSVRAFERNFQHSFQTSPKLYLMRVRLQAVRHRLINSSVPLSEVAQACGFYDQSHMTAQFTRHFGLSPRRYRVENTGLGYRIQ